jgi:hypothetical protein
MLALLVALGGTAWAANSIGTNQIRNQAVTTAKIRNNAVTSPKIRKNAVNSWKIGDYGVLRNVRVRATDGPDSNAARNAAPRKPLFWKGPLVLYAKCFRDTGANSLYGEIYVRTKKAFSIMEGTDDLEGGPLASDYLNPNTPEIDRQLDTQTLGGVATDYAEDESMVAIPGGPAVSFVTGIGVKNGPVLANGPYGPGNACLFQGGAFG